MASELIHTCYRIGEIERSVEFYEALGFEERRRKNIRDEAVNVFMGLPGDADRLELTYNHGVDAYELGTGYNHIAVTVEDLDRTLEALAAKGIDPERPPYRVRSEEHTSELQSRQYLVCRLLLEKKTEHGPPRQIDSIQS